MFVVPPGGTTNMQWWFAPGSLEAAISANCLLAYQIPVPYSTFSRTFSAAFHGRRPDSSLADSAAAIERVRKQAEAGASWSLRGCGLCRLAGAGRLLAFVE
jgi:hypothetical protein